MLDRTQGQREGLCDAIARQVTVTSVARQTGRATTCSIDALHRAQLDVQHPAVTVGEDAALCMRQ